MLLVTLLVLLPLWAYRVGPRRPRLSSWIGVLGAAALPFALPPNADPTAGLLRMVASAWAIIYAAKSWERAHDNVLDRRMLASPSRFLVWWFVPPDTRPTSGSARARLRLRALARLWRSLPKLAVAATCVLANRGWHLEWNTPWLTSAWAMVLLYTCISGIADVVTGSAMRLGFEVAEPFRAPMLAASPRDFWSRRWNRYVSEFARRNLYWRRGGRARPLQATLAVFFMSGLMHEYLVVALLSGFGRHTGWSFSFFALHGLLVVADTRWRWFARLPRPIATATHLIVLWMTSPLFFIPLDEATGFTRW